MSVTGALSSQVGDRTEGANREVAARCLAEPELLREIADGLRSENAALVGDCAEVMTKVAESRPELVSPFAPALIALLSHQTTRVRWEAMHALALVAPLIAGRIRDLLPRLEEIIEADKSTIVRDHAVEAVGRYGGTGEGDALRAYPVLRQALTVWGGKHAGRALDGMTRIVPVAPKLRDELAEIGHRYLEHDRGVVKKAAGQLIRALDNA